MIVDVAVTAERMSGSDVDDEPDSSGPTTEDPDLCGAMWGGRRPTVATSRIT